MIDIGRDLVIVVLLFAACSSGGGGTNTETKPPSDAGTETGGGSDAWVVDAEADPVVPGSDEGAGEVPDGVEVSGDLGGTAQPDQPAEDIVGSDDAPQADAAADGSAVDAVPDTSAPPAIGSPCTAETACPAGGSGTPACQTDWPGGYCLVVACAAHGHDCPGDAGLGGTQGSKCVKAPDPTCLALCDSAADCREGYDCVPKPDAAGHGSVAVCYPK